MRRDRLGRALAELADCSIGEYFEMLPEREQVDTWADLYEELVATGYPCFAREARLGGLWRAATDEDREAAWAWWVRHCRGRLQYPKRQVKLWNVWGRFAPGAGIHYITTASVIARDMRKEVPHEQT